jgi:hypothetical protein
MAVAEDPHGGALDRDPRGPIQMRRQLFIGPVRAIELTALRALFHPLWDGRRQRFRYASPLAGRPVDRQTFQPSGLIGLEPEPHGRAMHP